MLLLACVTGVGQKWRWAFYSCNGFHESEAGAKLGGIQVLRGWRLGGDVVPLMWCSAEVLGVQGPGATD
jgi:hypothetical protein